MTSLNENDGAGNSNGANKIPLQIIQNDANASGGTVIANETDIGNTKSLLPETGVTVTDGSVLPTEFNNYRNKKTMTQGLMDIALFSANANQLRYVLNNHSSGKDHSTVIYIITATMLIASLIIQIAVGVMLLISTRYSVCTNQNHEREKAYRCGNYVIVGTFLVTILNVFITSFGGSTIVS